MTLELIVIVTAVEGGSSSKNKNRPIVEEYIKIKVNGNNYDHIREQMDEFVSDFKKANNHYSSVQWTWEKASEHKEELGGGIE
jgi:argonaute-like protein implicated in RNA metabolism and viral defense